MGGEAAEKLDYGFFEKLARAIEHFRDMEPISKKVDGENRLFQKHKLSLDGELRKYAKAIPRSTEKEILIAVAGKKRRASLAEITEQMRLTYTNGIQGEQVFHFQDISENGVREALRRNGIVYSQSKRGRKKALELPKRRIGRVS